MNKLLDCLQFEPLPRTLAVITLILSVLVGAVAVAQSPPPRTQQQPQTQQAPRRIEPQPQTQQHRSPPSGPIFDQHRTPRRYPSPPPTYYPPYRYYPRPTWGYPPPTWQYPRYTPPRPSGYWSWDSVNRRWVWRQNYRGF